MTECERIIKKGVINKEFLSEEIRNEFVVDVERKKLWAVELDLFLELKRVCEKHNLKIFLIGGSLLGAIRHNGFIPWDDDIDVGMMREDYEKLQEIGNEEFDEPYFLQTPYTDEGYYISYIKLRNSNTTALSYNFRYSKFNQGIAIDIFAFDNCSLSDVKERYEKINSLILDNSAYIRKANPNPSEADKKRIAMHSGNDPMEVYEKIRSIAMQYYKTDTQYVNIATCTTYSYDRLMIPKHMLNELTLKPFEQIDAPVPFLYEDVLSICYGEWKKFPPVDQRGNWHAGEIFTADMSYTKYRKDVLNIVD